MLIKLRKVNNLLTVRPLSDQLCQALEAQLRYTRKISLHGKEAELAHSHIRLEERNLFCYSQNRLVTPVGFLPRVSNVIKKLGHTIDYANLIPHPRPQAFEPCWECVDRYMARSGMKFRVKQKELLQKLVVEDRGGVDCSVGWGKSAMFRLIPLLLPKARIDIVTTAADVVRQIRNDVSDTGIRVGQLGAGKRDVQARVVVVCAKSLHRCTFDDTDIVLADEAQELATDGYLEQLAQYTKARMFMFSATVGMRMDSADIELEGCFGPTILKVPFQIAAQDKAVVPIKVQWVPVASDYNPGAGLSGTRRSRRAIWRHGFRNRIIADTARTVDADAQTLVVVDKIEHALALKEFLPEYTLVYAEAGLTPAKRVKFAKSGLVIKDEPPMTLQRRIWLKKQFESGELKKVIATGVWNRGVNFKKLAVLIRADAGGSAINDTQIPGRVCRLAEGKEFGLVIDFTDQFDRGYQQRAKRRRKNYESNGWTQHHEGLGKSLLRNQHLQ